MTITVTNEVDIVEIDGKDIPPVGKRQKLIVKSHWNRNELVILTVDGNTTFTVNGKDLCEATKNAQNIARY